MIKATELRPNSWVLEEGVRLRQITALGIYHVEQGFVDVFPIVLTEDILLKCGFEFISSQQGQTYYHKDGWIVLQSYGKWHYSPSLSNTVGKSIDYLHQLQDLYFALTGEELNVEL